MSKTDKLNILLIMADQLAAQALSMYGNRVCRTPNLDRLAAEGLVFDNCYTNFPLCVPARASMLSGRLPTSIDAFDNASELSASVPTMAHYLRSAGYRTILSGKMHFIGPDQVHGFNERLTTDVYPSTFKWIADWNAGPQFVPSGTALNGVVESGPSIRTMQEDFDDEVEYQSVQKIYDLARDPNRQPFFLLTSFTNPHTPFTCSDIYWDRYKADEIDLPAVSEIPFEDLDYHSKALFFAHGRHRHRLTEEHLRRARHGYYGMISYIDDKIGNLLEALERTGLCDNTLFIFISDHGEMLGERGLWFKQHFWDWSAKVPMIFNMPGTVAARRCDKVVSLVDLLPTLLDVANASFDQKFLSQFKLDGRSLAGTFSGDDELCPDLAISDYFAIGPCVPCRMVRKGRYKFYYTHGHPNMLFDMERDSNELNSIAGQSEYNSVESELQTITFTEWDPDALSERIVESQVQRKLIARATEHDQPWNYLARTDDGHRYVREGGVDDTKGRLRLPFVEMVPPDWPALDSDTIQDLIYGRQKLTDVIPDYF